MLSRRQFVVAGAAGAASLLLPGCGKEDSEPSKGGGLSADSPTKFTMQSAWVNDAEFMGYFIAMDKGWYKEEGLDLIYKSGGPDIIPESKLLAKQADLALTTPDTTIELIAKKGAKLKIIGTQYQKSPLGVVSLKGSGIKTPKDLKGKRLGVPPVNVISVEAVLTLNGIKKEELQVVPYQYDPTPLINGDVDATIDFTTNVPYTIEQKGKEVEHFLLYDYGFRIFNDTVVVREETLRTKREQLVAWLRASRRGWEENLKDTQKYPPQFADSHFKGTGRTIENELYFNKAQASLIDHPDGVFTMTEEGIQANIETLNKIGIEAQREMFVTDLLEEI